MKKKYILLSTLVASGLLFSFTHFSFSEGVYAEFNSARFHQLNTSGPAAGNAGAPGENNCTACHAGQVQAGAGFNILNWGDAEAYIPGETYSITLSMQDASSKNGFQLVPLKASDNSAAGNVIVTNATTTQIRVGQANKQYLTQRSAGTSTSSWSFDWTAPSTDQGHVIFYVATNKTNSNNGSSGDLVRLSQHTFNSAGASSSLTLYEEIQNSLEMLFNQSQEILEISFTVQDTEELYLNLVNLQGQSVLAQKLGQSYPGDNQKTVKMPRSLPAGLYIANFFVGNKAYSQKIWIE